MSFRQLDVDQYDPNSPVNVTIDIEPSGITLNDVEKTKTQIKSALQSGDTTRALCLALANPPYGSDDETKSAALMNVLSILTVTRAASIPQIVNDLDATERNVLVKYLYKAMSVPQGQSNSSILLTWLEYTLKETGHASIIKYITDRRTV